MTAERDRERDGVALKCLAGDDGGPIDLRGEECRAVFIGDRALGGGSLRRAARIAVGSGIVPIHHLVLLLQCKHRAISRLTFASIHTLLLYDGNVVVVNSVGLWWGLLGRGEDAINRLQAMLIPLSSVFQRDASFPTIL